MKRRISAVTLVFLIIFFIYLMPIVKASEKIGEGYPSRVPIWNNSIDQDYSFDGANYRMITKYGDYVWLQPGNIMEFFNLDGEEVIDKSVWVLQHNINGIWLSLLDFDNQRIVNVNETVYEIAYDVKYKDKGSSQIVGSVEIGFYSSGYSMNKPKIIVNFTKGSGWNELEMGSFRWIWDIVPKGSWTKYVNETSKTNTDILNYEVIGKSSKIHFSKISEYSDLEKWIVLDVSDYGSVDFRGGDESFFNTQGFIIIFAENEGYIDPVTIANGFDASSTDIEQQRKVFRNPRGLEYYYALFEGGNGFYHFYNSSDGETWTRVLDWWSSGREDSMPSFSIPDMIFFEDETNNRLIVLMVYSLVNINEDVLINAIEINDTGEVDFLYLDVVGTATDDGIHFPNIEIDDDGYIWVSWTDEWTRAGKQRNDIYVKGTVETYPVISATWNISLKVFDGGVTTENPTINAKSELTRIYTTGDMAIVWYRDFAGSEDLFGKILSRGDPPTAGPQITISLLAQGEPSSEFSCIAETEVDSDVFILWERPQVFFLNQWDISVGTVAQFGTVPYLDNEIQSPSLSLRSSTDPDKLLMVGIQENHIFCNSSPVDSWESTEIFNISEPGKWNYTSSFWESESEIILIYTNQTAPFDVRFLIFEFGPDIAYPDAPELLFGAGFNGSDGFVLIHWNHSLLNYTDFEVHNSSDGVVFTFLDNVSLPWLNHTGLTNMTYHYYRVRARNFMAWYDQYFNSSWSAINLERVRFETTLKILNETINLINGTWEYHNVSSILVSVGTHDSGDVNSTLDIDGDTYNCSEAVGVPGYIVEFNFTNVNSTASCLWVVAYIYYDGNQAHDIHVELYNQTSLTWVEIDVIDDDVAFEWHNSSIYELRIPSDFINATGSVFGRFNHVAAGNINHDIYIEYLKLHAFMPSGLAEVGAVIEEFQFFWIVLAIALMLIGIVISKMWQEAGDS